MSISLPRPLRRGLSRGSGGVLVYVEDCFAQHITIIDLDTSHGIAWLRADGIFGEHTVYICCAYIPPADSVLHKAPDSIDYFTVLGSRVADIQAQGDLVLMAGDFNARTGSLEDFICTEALSRHVQELQPETPIVDVAVPARANMDTTTNVFGTQLLDLCRSSGLLIMNGRTRGDTRGEFTFRSSDNASTVDYFVASPQLLTMADTLTVHRDIVVSDHFPLELVFNLPCSTAAQRPPTHHSISKHIPRFKYDITAADAYRDKLQCLLSEHLDPEMDAQKYVTKLQNCITEAAADVYGLKVSSAEPKTATQPQNAWFDDECKHMRKQLGAALRSSGCDAAAKLLHKQYKNMLKKKKADFRHTSAQEFCDLVQKKPQKFWATFKTCKRQDNTITKEEWFTSFSTLLNPGSSAHTPTMPASANTPTSGAPSHHSSGGQGAPQGNSPPSSAVLDMDITASEVLAAIEGMQRNKAAGIDGIKAEFLKDAAACLVAPLTALFNKVFTEGAPAEWNIGIIHPIFKKGDASDPGNYRGITVGPVLSKLFAMILDNRLHAWTEEHHLRAKGQAGFRRDHRTTDNLFILRTIIEDSRASGRKLFTCFVDFRKAFDTIPRDVLWQVLERLGISTKLLRCLQSMYSNDSACVFTPSGLTDTFSCSMGVKQGCPLSPMLFGLYIDGLEDFLADVAPAPVIDGVAVPLLLYADDLVLLSHTRSGLQDLLDRLHEFCQQRRLSVNIEKTKAVIFCRGRVPSAQPVVYDEEAIEYVQSFRYLGIDLHQTRGFTFSAEHLASAGLKAAFALRRRCAELGIRDVRLKCRLFDALVVPVLSYGCEIWGTYSENDHLRRLERVHTQFLRGMLGLPISTPSAIVLAEFGRTPLRLHWGQQVVRYWNRLMCLDDHPLLQAAVNHNLRLMSYHSPYIWSRQMCLFFCQHNTGGLVSFDEPVDEAAVVASLTSQYIESSLQPADASRKLRTYNVIRGEGYAFQSYLTVFRNLHQRRVLCQFRVGSHWLRVQMGRFERLPYESRHCMQCESHEVDDEMHMIFDCPHYTALRAKYAELFIGERKCLHEFLSHHPILVAKFLTECKNTRICK